MTSRRPWATFRLRTLLIGIGLFSGGLWWWFRPFTVYESAGYGMTCHYTARRSWDGRRYYLGPAILVYPNGRLAAKDNNVDGVEVNSVSLWGENDKCEYWLDDGTKLGCHEEWFAFLSFDFIPRQMHGEPLKTEKQWRAIATELKTAVQE